MERKTYTVPDSSNGICGFLNLNDIACGPVDATTIVCDVPDDETDASIQALIPQWPPVPQVVTIAQARRALAASPGPNSNTMLDVVIGYMAGVPQTDPRQIMWEYSATFSRQDPILLQVTTALGLTSSQVDGLFLLAASFTT